MKEIRCRNCDVPMEKGHFVPNFGSLGLNWTDKLKFSKWKIESLKTWPTFQYRCPECGLIETYADLDDPK